MGFDVKVEPGTLQPLELRTAVRRGLLAAGRQVLAVSDLGAPRDDEPTHGVHMTETGFVRAEPGIDEDAVTVGYTAWWALFAHEDMYDQHPNGGHAKFLEIALVQSDDVVAEEVGASVAKALE